MAEVDHAYQYSVEVKSRFSLFLDDPLSNEDPDVLQNRILNERAGRKKKEKSGSISEVTVEGDQAQETVPKADAPSSHVKNVSPPKQQREAQPPISVSANDAVSEVSKATEQHDVTAPRGRGMPRGFGRGGRGRGQGPRPAFNEGPPSGEHYSQNRESHFEPRGRGRGRGGFSRGRGAAYTDYRELERPMEHERMPRSLQQREATEVAESPADAETSQQMQVAENGDVEATGANEPEKDDGLVNGDSEAAEEPKSYTLKEYKAMLSSTKPAVALATKGSRKANDGKDVFANMVAHKKIVEVSDEEIEEVEPEPEAELPFEINVTFTDRFTDRGRGSYGGRGSDRSRGTGFRGSSNRPRGSRGTRGGFRGISRGRGFARGGGFEHQAAPPPIYSDQDFPSLK